MNTAVKLDQIDFDTPALQKVDLELQRESREFQTAFQLMGWQELPDELKAEIAMDVAAMINELKGSYCTSDPLVLQRRKSVRYWVEAYQNNQCSLKTAAEALSIH